MVCGRAERRVEHIVEELESVTGIQHEEKAGQTSQGGQFTPHLQIVICTVSLNRDHDSLDSLYHQECNNNNPESHSNLYRLNQ